MKFDTLKEAVDFSNIEELKIDGLDERNPHQSWLKNMYRKSSDWKDFCEYLISKKEVCERCGCSHKEAKSGLQVHHKDPRNYNDLTEEKFVVLCGVCHLKIESYCITEERMKLCPNVDKKFLTLYPYKEPDSIVLGKGSGKFKIRKWCKELDATKNPNKYISKLKPMRGVHKKEVKDAVEFMKLHPELF
jgi:hypothetical protein